MLAWGLVGAGLLGGTPSDNDGDATAPTLPMCSVLHRWRFGFGREAQTGNPEDTASCRAAALGPSADAGNLSALGRALPKYMVKAAGGDERQALQNWIETLQWRCDINDESLLRKPNHNLERISKHYPTFLHLPDKAGRLTYWEILGGLDPSGMASEGITAADIVHNYIWHTFFTWDVAARDDEHEVTVIVDLQGFHLTSLTPSIIRVFVQVSSLLRKHFPQREHGVFFINCPPWWHKIYQVLAPLVSSRQRSMAHVIVGKENSERELKRLIDRKNLPAEYGGASGPLGSSPLEKRKRKLASSR
eukprot:TRINITY_DN41756_c0_g1_i1.p1 TRINITY_DN41756_c0_g1~~TRINITY_DN41756_c0_g1_i1.p1  ORF type:complete len:350 (+),score=33.31 TRINITY_DN41756_c0_g1_i1:140-1051(+)